MKCSIIPIPSSNRSNCDPSIVEGGKFGSNLTLRSMKPFPENSRVAGTLTIRTRPAPSYGDQLTKPQTAMIFSFVRRTGNRGSNRLAGSVGHNYISSQTIRIRPSSTAINDQLIATWDRESMMLEHPVNCDQQRKSSSEPIASSQQLTPSSTETPHQ